MKSAPASGSPPRETTTSRNSSALRRSASRKSFGYGSLSTDSLKRSTHAKMSNNLCDIVNEREATYCRKSSSAVSAVSAIRPRLYNPPSRRDDVKHHALRPQHARAGARSRRQALRSCRNDRLASGRRLENRAGTARADPRHRRSGPGDPRSFDPAPSPVVHGPSGLPAVPFRDPRRPADLDAQSIDGGLGDESYRHRDRA